MEKKMEVIFDNCRNYLELKELEGGARVSLSDSCDRSSGFFNFDFSKEYHREVVNELFFRMIAWRRQNGIEG